MNRATSPDLRPNALLPGRYVYLAGPMRGKPRNNFPAFDRMAARLRSELGLVVVNPADLDRDEFGYDGSQPVDEATVKAMLLRDLRALEACEAMALLPGWRRSAGSRGEVAHAIVHGIPMWEVVGDRFLIPYRGLMQLPRRGQ